MIVANLIRKLLPSGLLVVPEEKRTRDDRIARKVVARSAEGSVRLGQGRYRTSEVIEADINTVRNTQF